MKRREVRVSVVVPAHNVERYIGATLDSLLRQTLSELEVIVVDDASADGTCDVVGSFRDDRIVLLRHEVNRGLASARNTGIDHARGEFIALLDADDVAVPCRLQQQVAALQRDPALGMVGSHVAVINEDGRDAGYVWKRPVTSEDATIRMLFRNTFSAVTTMRKSAIPPGGYWQLPMAEDYDFNVRMADAARVLNLDRALTRVRMRAGGLTQSRKELMERCVRDVMREQIGKLGIAPTPRELELNRHVGGLTLPNSPEMLAEVEAWMMKLRDANSAVGRYPEPAFLRILAEEWFDVCTFASPLGEQAFRIWRTSPLAGFHQPSMGKRLKFFARCLLRHGRPGGDVASLAQG